MQLLDMKTAKVGKLCLNVEKKLSKGGSQRLEDLVQSEDKDPKQALSRVQQR